MYNNALKHIFIVPCSFLTEQYDAFVKFSHDQVERRLAESAFSCKLQANSQVPPPCTKDQRKYTTRILASL